MRYDSNGGQSFVREIVRYRELVAVAHSGFVLLVWRNGPTVESARRVARLFEFYERNAIKVDFAAVIQSVRDYPNEEARTRLATSMRSPAIRRVALINEDEGFKASIIRSIISGMSMLVGANSPSRVFSSFRDAEFWLHTEDSRYQNGEIRNLYDELIFDAGASV